MYYDIGGWDENRVLHKERMQRTFSDEKSNSIFRVCVAVSANLKCYCNNSADSFKRCTLYGIAGNGVCEFRTDLYRDDGRNKETDI